MRGVRHGHHGTLTYARWKSMLQRCSETNQANKERYSGKGIRVCNRWQDFKAFLADMGECPGPEMTLDRIDNNKGYEPGNCRWATKADQNRNRPSFAVMLTHNGITQSATDWAQALGITANTLLKRIQLGWTHDRALTQPIKRRTKRE